MTNPTLGTEPDPNNPSNQSAKDVFVFEALTRSKGQYLRFNSPLKIRHYPSGKYLAVDTDGNTRLVDDCKVENEERDVKWDLCDLSDMTFYVMSTEVTNSDFIPNTAWSVRIEFRPKDSPRLYFMKTRESLVEFSSNQNVLNQNVLKVMPIDRPEHEKLSRTKDFIRACKTYSNTLSDPKNQLNSFDI